MFLSTVVPTSKFNINVKNVDPYQFTLPYNFTRGKTICIEILPLYAADMNNYTSNRLVRGHIEDANTYNTIIITIPTDTTIHTANMDIKSRGNWGSQTQRWLYNVNITCNTVENTITFTPISYTHIQGTIYRTLVDDYFTSPALITIHTIL